MVLVLAGSALTLALVGPADARLQDDTGAGPAVAAFEAADADADRVSDALERQVALAQGELIGVIVAVDGPVDDAALDALASRVGPLESRNPLPSIGAFSAKVSAAQIEALRTQPEVTLIEWSAPVRAANAEATLHGGADAVVDGLGHDGNRDGNATSYSAADSVVAILDTGIDSGHPDLDGGKVIAFVDCTGGVCTAKPAFDDDPAGHGTHVAATAAGTGDGVAANRGVAPGAALVGIKVLDSTGTGFVSDVAAGIQWAMDNKATYGIEVLNLSVEGTSCPNFVDAASAAINAAFDAGLLSVVASGNLGPGVCTVTFPGTAEKALTVGAAADPSEGGWSMAAFSGRGPTFDNRIKPDLVAPGVNILSAAVGTSGYSTLSGTSMATPFVAGVALLLHDADPTAGAQELFDAIKTSADNYGGLAVPNNTYGRGRIDAEAAVASVLAMKPLPPPPPPPTNLVVAVPAAEDGSTLEVSWTTPQPSQGDPIVSYTVSADGQSVVVAASEVSSAAIKSVVLTGVDRSVAQTVTVTATTSKGQSSSATTTAAALQSRIFVSNVIASGPAEFDFVFAPPGAAVVTGDWTGDGRTGFASRVGNLFTLVDERGNPQGTASFGKATDEIFIGDWNASNQDTFGVRRGNVFFLRNTPTSGIADIVLGFGKTGDEVFVGDWNGNGQDTFAVRRGNVFFVRNSTTTGIADIVFGFGKAGDEVLVGDWDQDGIDSFAVRRGKTIFIRNDFVSGPAQTTITFGKATDQLLVGDYNADGVDTFAVRRLEPVT
ncbi:MAG: S8 family serine peptidase [Acidimicrobiia bacterium]|nr:S8 family serine peptidase [Acidimicrobiia bacterium]